MNKGETVYVLYEEVSDQYGTSEVVGVYSSEKEAEDSSSTTKRNYIRVFTLDGKPQ